MPDYKISYKNISPVSDDKLTLINNMLANTHISVPTAMAYIRKIQGWSFQQLEQRIKGLSKTTLQSYLQPSYPKIRPLHVVAAYSWLTMLPMTCFYRGSIIKEAYPDMDDISVKCLIHSGLLPTKQFKLVILHLYNYLTKSQQQQVDIGIEAIQKDHGILNDYDDQDFLFPKSIDIKQFSYDYYFSLAIGCKKIREQNNLSIATMAKVVNLSVYRYQRLEDPENPVPLPVELGARLQLGFNLDNAMYFTINMKKYPQLNTVRKIQYIRQATLSEMMKYLDKENKKYFSYMVFNLSSMYLSPP